MAEKCTKEYTETPAYDLINRQAAIDLVRDVCNAVMSGCESWYDPETKDEVYEDIREVDAILKCNKEVRIALRNMPSAQPKLNKEKISDLLWNEYQEMSSHLPTEGVVARRYFCKELWKELFGEEETPVWMTW